MIHDNTGQYWLVFGGGGSVWSGTGWYLVIQGLSNLAFMPVYIEKSGDLVRCYHSSKQEGTPRVTSPQTLGKMNQDLAQNIIFPREN